jgi:hypothetical protein
VRKTGGGRVSAAAPPWTGSVCNWPNGLLARPAGRVEQVNAMVAKEELERLRSCSKGDAIRLTFSVTSVTLTPCRERHGLLRGDGCTTQ